MKLSTIIITIIFTCQVGFAIEFINYTTSDGLAYHCVHSIAIDSSGNKWFGHFGPGKASKFDDKEWTIYDIGIDSITNTVYDIIVDNEGNIWFSCFGIKKFDGDTTWIKFDTISARSIEIDLEGNMWFGCNTGVCKYDGISWAFYDTSDGLADKYVHTIAIDSEGNKWFGTYKGASKFDGNSWITFTTSDGLIDNEVNDIAIDAEDNKWFGTHGGLSKFNGNNWTSYDTLNGLAYNYIHSIAIDSKGNKWIGTNKGLCKFDDNSWITYTTSDGLISDQIQAIEIDKEGNIWIGNYYGGVSMIVDSSIGIQQEIPSNFTIPYNFIVSHNRGNISIGYTIPFSSRIKLESFDIQGRLVSTLVDAYKQAGKYTINFDLNKHSAGVYYIRLSMGNESIVRKAILLK